MYELNIRELKRSLSLLDKLDLNHLMPVTCTVDLTGNFALTTLDGMSFGTDPGPDPDLAPLTFTMSWEHWRIIKMVALIKNTITVEMDQGYAVFTRSGRTVYRFQTLSLEMT